MIISGHSSHQKAPGIPHFPGCAAGLPLLCGGGISGLGLAAACHGARHGGSHR